MAAANWKSSYGLGKQILKQIQSPSLAVTAIRRREVHASVYEKELEDYSNVCDIPNYNLITSYSYSEEYWAPHPQTGIFGPPNRGGGSQSCSSDSGGDDDKEAVSVLDQDQDQDQKVFFRPLEILDKPID